MRASIVQADPAALVELNKELLTPEGRIKLLPASEYNRIPRDHLRAWCLLTARYTLPTLELIEWLRAVTSGLAAIEVAAGNGDLGYHLGITSTDSYIQQSPEMQLYCYAFAGQAPTSPPADVVKMDAEAAVQHFQPQVTIASWLTRKFIAGKDTGPKVEASVYGPEEENILKGCPTYIHIGNTAIHGQKTILSQPHETYFFPWLVSRAQDPSQDCIKVWRTR